MFIYRDEDVRRVLALLTTEGFDAGLGIKYEIQDGGCFLLVFAEVGQAAIEFNSQDFLENSRKILGGAFPARYGDYSWMLVLLVNGSVIDAISSEMLI